MRTFATSFLAVSLMAQTGGYLAPKLPDHIKLEAAKPQQQAAPTTTVQAIDRRKPCAHILVYKPPKIDEKMIIGSSQGKEVQSKMPMVPPMEVCPEDVREMRTGPR